MNENNSDAIYEFGKEIIIEARDGVIRGLDDFMNGIAIGRCEKKFLEEFKKINFDEQQQKIIKLMVISEIDHLIHRLFVNFDESLGKYSIITKDKKGRPFDIVTESDGLPYGYFEFVDEFSKYKASSDVINEDISKTNWTLEK